MIKMSPNTKKTVFGDILYILAMIIMLPAVPVLRAVFPQERCDPYAFPVWE